MLLICCDSYCYNDERYYADDYVEYFHIVIVIILTIVVAIVHKGGLFCIVRALLFGVPLRAPGFRKLPDIRRPLFGSPWDVGTTYDSVYDRIYDRDDRYKAS